MSEFYESSKNMSRSRSDRYRNCDILKDVDTGENLLSTREPLDIPVRPDDTYHRVQSHEVCRLDLLAHQYYKNPLLWWVIASANDLYDPFESIESGTILRIPSIESLYGNNGILLQGGD